MAESLTKPCWKSKTIWFNAIVAALAAFESNAQVLQPFVPGNVYAWGLVLLTVGNTVLRTISSQGVTLK